MSAVLVGLGTGIFLQEQCAAAQPISFNEQVFPILERYCVFCHSPGGVAYKAINLDLRSYQGLMAGSQSGVAVIPRHPESSPLVGVLNPQNLLYRKLRMPPTGPPLSSEEIDVISRWIQEGAKDN